MIFHRVYLAFILSLSMLIVQGCQITDSEEMAENSAQVLICQTPSSDQIQSSTIYLFGPENQCVTEQFIINSAEECRPVDNLERGAWKFCADAYNSTGERSYCVTGNFFVESDEPIQLDIDWGDRQDPVVRFGSFDCEVSFADYAITNTYCLRGLGHENRTFSVSANDAPEQLMFTDLPLGRWNLIARGYDESGYLVSWHDTPIFILDTGRVSSTVEWSSDVVLSHGFSGDIQDYLYGGTAIRSIENGELVLRTHGSTAWAWNIFNHDNPGSMTTGSIEFDIAIDDQGGFFDFRGHSEQGVGPDPNWGPYFVFHNGQFLVRSSGQEPQIQTQLEYEPGTWYHLKLVFDNRLGNLGEYTLFLNERENETIIEDGPYSYYASYGRLCDLVQFSFGVAPQESFADVELRIDNLILREY